MKQKYKIGQKIEYLLYTNAFGEWQEHLMAEKRLLEAMDIGFTPMAMLYRNKTGETKETWKKFQRLWARAGLIYARKQKFL